LGCAEKQRISGETTQGKDRNNEFLAINYGDTFMVLFIV
jgi:hypothetical protein